MLTQATSFLSLTTYMYMPWSDLLHHEMTALSGVNVHCIFKFTTTYMSPELWCQYLMDCGAWITRPTCRLNYIIDTRVVYL